MLQYDIVKDVLDLQIKRCYVYIATKNVCTTIIYQRQQCWEMLSNFCFKKFNIPEYINGECVFCFCRFKHALYVVYCFKQFSWLLFFLNKFSIKYNVKYLTEKCLINNNLANLIKPTVFHSFIWNKRCFHPIYIL